MKLLARLTLLYGVVALVGCSLVDEDVRDCEADYSMDYEMQLVTNMTTEIETQLSMESDVAIITALEEHLKSVFTDYAHDVNLSFYDVVGDSLRVHHESHLMDATQSSYTLMIPVRKYMHLALANIVENPMIKLEDDEKCHTSSLHQVVRDTIESHRRGIFTARLPIEMQEDTDQKFDVSLYMANCAATLVLDTLGSHVKRIRVFTSDFATEFNIADSTYIFDYTPVIRADQVKVKEEGAPLCFTTVSFPSRSATETKVSIDSNDPFVSESAGTKLWHYRIYVDLEDGTTTETLLGVMVPLKPGQVKLVRAHVSGDGGVYPNDEYSTTVGVTITLDWSSGMDWDVTI
ncbi:MAG: hypothetical protein E7125_06455 [Bacteroidales bacterium]|nr:hypothetical protein [Bacteroidales bacterium]